MISVIKFYPEAYLFRMDSNTLEIKREIASKEMSYPDSCAIVMYNRKHGMVNIGLVAPHIMHEPLKKFVIDMGKPVVVKCHPKYYYQWDLISQQLQTINENGVSETEKS